MKKWLILSMMCLALGLVFAGCGDDDEDSGGGGSAETSEQPAEHTGTSGGGTKAVEVGMEGIAFDPEDVTVAKGATVKWTNNEDVPHDVTKKAGPGPDFSSGKGNMQKDDTYEQTFHTAGKIDYVCTVHPNMTGTVTVE